MGDFKLNWLQGIIAVIAVKWHNWKLDIEREKNHRQVEKMRKKLDKEYYQSHKK